MRRLLHLFSLCLLFALYACTQAGQQPEAIPAKTLPVEPGQAVAIQVNTGAVTILGTDAGQLEISGRLAAPERTTYLVSTDPRQIDIQAEYRKPLFSTFSGPAVELEVRIPQDVTLQVVTFDAAVTVRDLRGKVEVDSTSGDILGENLSGTIALRSGRGDVRAVACSGKVRVLGEHGVLSIENARGEVSSSTIMGTIRFAGEPRAGDSIRLETDHGPVRIELGAGSGLELSVNSTSGNVVCGLPGLDTSTRFCRGKLGNGEGAMTVRTVSGGVTVQSQP